MLNLQRGLLPIASFLTACCALCAIGHSAAAAAEGGAAPKANYRRLAPGVENQAPMERKVEETVDAHDLIEMKLGVPNLEWTPNESAVSETLMAKSTDTMFRRGVWQFQFSFKPMRMLRVDLPQADGTMRRTLVWYIVYRITNPGQHMTPVLVPSEKVNPQVPPPEGVYKIERVDTAPEMLASIAPHRFIPIFKLKSVDPKIKGEWMDQIIPLAKEAIYQRERPPCKIDEFCNTVEIARSPIPLSTARLDNSVWGYVTWIGGDPPKAPASEINPDLNNFAVDIWGLTNAYKWADPPGAYKVGDPPGTGRVFVQKVLEINFTRVGDALYQNEREIHLGIKGQVDWQWIYR